MDGTLTERKEIECGFTCEIFCVFVCVCVCVCCVLERERDVTENECAAKDS